MRFLLHFTKAAAVGAVVLTTAGSFADVDTTEVMRLKQSEETARLVTEKRALIAAETKEISSPWSGEYFAGDGLGVNTTLSVASKNGFVFEWRGCMGVYDRNYGSARMTTNIIELQCELPNVKKGFRGLAVRFYPIKWGERRYLIPEDEVAKFCNEVNSRREPRTGMHGTFLLRIGDENTTVAGRPELPEEYAAWILKEPLTGEITAVDETTTESGSGNTRFQKTRVTVSIGRRDGAYPGMKLYSQDRNTATETVDLVEVGDYVSTGLSTQIVVRKDAPRLEVGWKMGTLPTFWRAQNR